MENTKVSIPNLSFKYGLLISFSFILYFIIMKYMDLLYVTSLRFLNIFILIIGLIAAFRYYRKKTKILNIDYFEGLGLGVLTSFISFTLFGAFIYVYFLKIDPALLEVLKGNTVMLGNNSTTALYTAASVLFQGICSGVIISFVIMQYYRSGFYKTLNEKRKNDIRV